MTLVQLEYLVAVDTYGSFVLAAEKCHITQPTLSMQIQKLEDTLGVKLFDRSRHPVLATDVGARVVEQARKVLSEAREINELIAGYKGEIKGELKIGIIPTLAPYLLPRLITGMVANYPQLQLKIWEFTTAQIVTQLKSGQLDCALLSTPLDDAQLHERPLFYETFTAYLSPSSSLVHKAVLQAADISPDELWLLNEGHCMRNQVLNICAQRDLENKDAAFEYHTGSVETLKKMVDLDHGVTILPELSLADLNPEQVSRVRRFDDPQPAREISLVTHRNFMKRSSIQAVEQELLKMIPAGLLSATGKDVMSISIPRNLH